MPSETMKYLFLFKVNILHGKFLEQRSFLSAVFISHSAE